MSKTVAIDLPDDVFTGFSQEPEQLARELRVAAAVKWYEIGRLSQGKAAEVAGLSRAQFITELSRFGVSPLQESAAEALAAADPAQV